MGGSSTIATSETKIEALRLQSSAYGVTIPLVGGVARVPLNLLAYYDFTATPHTSTQGSGGKGGGVQQSNTTYTYTAGVLMGICQGPGVSVARIWKDKEVLPGGWSAAQVLTASETYAVPSSGAMNYTLVQGAKLIGRPHVTVSGSIAGQIVALGVGYSLAGGVLTVLDAALRSRTLTITYQYGSGTADTASLAKLGLTLLPGDISQSAPAWMTSLHPTEAIGHPGLAFMHAQSYALGNGGSVENHSVEVQGSGAYRYGSASPDCNPAEFAADVLLNGRYGARVPAELYDGAAWITYCAAAGLLMSPALTEQRRASDFLEEICRLTNSAPVWSVDRLRIVPYGDVALTANGQTYTPNTTPQYDIDDDSWLQDGTDDPLQWEIKQPSDRYNHVRVEFCDRSNYYNKTIAEAKDDADIALYGLRTMTTVNAPWICDGAVARLVAQIVLQRSLSITGSGTLKLPWAYCLLEPMDLITITDIGLGFDHLPVRITAVGESEDGDLEVEVEDWPLGAASPTRYPAQTSGGYQHDYGAAPGSVSTPVIFEAPVELTTTGLEVYAAVKGAGAAWGGCRVWVSLDGTTYREAGVVYGPSRYGTLSAAAAAASATIAVTGMSGQLLNGSATDATALQTLCYVGGTNPEYLAYQTATLTGAGAYTLSSLVHGAYGSNALPHASGDAFVRVDQAIAKSGPLTLDFIGKTISFKFTSFNIYGRNEQSLASATAYTYTVLGTMAKLPPPAVSGLTAGQYPGGVQISWNAAGVPDYADTELRVGTSYALGTRIFKGNAQTYSWPWPTPGTQQLWAVHYDKLGNASTTAAGVSVTVNNSGLIQSTSLVPSSVTDVVSLTGASGSLSAAAGVASISQLITPSDYTNPLTTAIQVTITVCVYGTVLTNTSAAAEAQFVLVWAVGTASSQIFGRLAGVGSKASDAQAVTVTITLPGSAILTGMDLRAVANNFSGSSGTSAASWTSSSLRIEAIKR